jgi:hypothetical protein
MSEEKSTDPSLESLFNEYKECMDYLKQHLEKEQQIEVFKGDDLEVTLLRYAKGFLGDQEAALASLIQAVDIRKEFRGWEVPDCDTEAELVHNTPHLELVIKHYPSKFFHVSQEPGVPASFRLIGRANAAALTKQLPLEDWRESVARRIIAHFRKLNKVSREKGRLIMQDSVLDLYGLTQSHMSYMSYFQVETTIAQVLAPETMKSLLTINAPWFFNILWKITSNFISERTLAKSSVVGTSNKEILSKMTEQLGGEQFVPEMYGGKCQCGSCVVAPDPYEGMTKENVSAGSKKSLEVAVGKDDVLEWSWMIAAKDIACQIDFLPDGEPEESIQSIQEGSRESPASGESSDGHFEAPQKGTFRITFDNSFSYWSGKTIYYKITTTPATKRLSVEN